jgi:hypothetical protein
MKNVTNPDQLRNTCRKVEENGAIGILLSGGCKKNGEMLNLRKLLPTIHQIKKETNLIIKLHTGLVTKELAENIVDAGVDIASLEVVGTNETIHEIFDFKATVESYENSLVYLKEAGMPYIVPHVCIGLHYGKLRGEFFALDIIKRSCNPAVLVFIVFRPTKGTPMEISPLPKPDDVARVFQRAKELFPDKDLSLGCIRPRTHYRKEIEHAALLAGATRMEIPSPKTIQLALDLGYQLRKIHACCALPEDLEEVALDTLVLDPHGHSE